VLGEDEERGRWINCWLLLLLLLVEMELGSLLGRMSPFVRQRALRGESLAPPVNVDDDEAAGDENVDGWAGEEVNGRLGHGRGEAVTSTAGGRGLPWGEGSAGLGREAEKGGGRSRPGAFPVEN
jgi:hypothetical protein